MKIFGFEIRKFEKDPTTIEVIETWCVKWESLHYRYLFDSAEARTNVQAFMTKEGAEEYAKELSDARKLLGDTNVPVKFYKQKTPTNI